MTERGVTELVEETRRMPISRLGGASPLPRFRWQQPTQDRNTPPNRGLTPEESSHGFQWGKDSILPYRVYDDYDRAQAEGEMALLVLRNARFEISVAPQWGGRLMSMRDRVRGRDLVFTNPVFQPANLAALNAWFSGGIEWNGLIPGHTPFTTARVFAGLVETERGPILRLYEFDRIVEATWQIDLLLPDDDDRLFVHGRIVNANPTPRLAYWWTNVAAPMVKGMRVLSPADYSIEHVLPGNELARFPFPDPERFDGSYPDRWRDATSVFFRAPEADRRFIAALDPAGTGLAQTSTATLQGRKFFFFGTAPGGQQWMDFLARPGEGDYIEIQSGVAPTQNQRFELAGGSATHWTEVYGLLEVEPEAAHDPNYQRAVAATRRAIDERYPATELADIDAFLTRMSREPVTRRLSAGAPWGMRQERLIGRPLAEGLDFAVDAPHTLWDDLAAGRPIAAEALDAVPDEMAVSDLWVETLRASVEAEGETWLHALLLGIAALDREDRDEAAALFERSVALRPSWLGLRQRALLASDPARAEADYLAAWETGEAPPALAAEIVAFLIRTDRLSQLDAFVAGLPEAALSDEQVHMARARLAAQQGDLDLLERLLQRRFATVREGDVLLSDLWIALMAGRLAQTLGRQPSAEELTQHLARHPVPAHLDFRMREPDEAS